MRLVTSMLVVAATLLGGVAQADEIPGSVSTVAGWRLSAYDDRGRFAQCSVASTYRSGFALIFALSGDGTWRLGLTHPKMRYTASQREPLQLYVDGAGPSRVVAVARSANLTVAELPGDLFGAIRRGRTLTVAGASGARQDFDLSGTDAALQAVSQCVQRYTAAASGPRPAAPVTPPPPQVATQPPPAASSSGQSRPDDRGTGELTRTLSDAQAMRLHQDVCSMPVRQTTQDRRTAWLCDRPRAYPNPKSPCALSFPADKAGRFQIFFGQFTAVKPQAIAMYSAECEPHANEFGGMTLFDIVGQKFELVRYFPGHRYADCVVPPGQGGLQRPYCIGGHMGQGTLSESFGPLTFAPDGSVKRDGWFDAGNNDGYLTAMTGCDAAAPEPPHHLIGVGLDPANGDIVLEAAVRDPRAVANACDRFRRNDFSAAERNWQKMSELAKGRAFIRDDEQKFVKLLVRFRPPNKKPELQLTSQAVQ